MYNYCVHLHYWPSGHVPCYTLTVVQMPFLLLACKCTYILLPICLYNPYFSLNPGTSREYPGRSTSVWCAAYYGQYSLICHWNINGPYINSLKYLAKYWCPAIFFNHYLYIATSRPRDIKSQRTKFSPTSDI